MKVFTAGLNSRALVPRLVRGGTYQCYCLTINLANITTLHIVESRERSLRVSFELHMTLRNPDW
jgi:hypothetical protein